MSVLPTWMYVHGVHGYSCYGQKRALDLLGLELWTVVGYLTDAGN